MIRPSKRYLFALVNSEGLSYYVHGYTGDGKAIVFTSAEPKWLDFNPENWQETETSYGRSDKYFGINRSFTPSYKFVNDGADILRYFIYTKGFEKKIYLIILQHNADNDTYEPYYKGEVDYTQFDDQAAKYLEVNMMEGGLLKYLNANDGVKYELSKGNVPIVYDGVLLQDKYNYSFIEVNTGTTTGQHILTLPLAFINNEGDSIGIYKGDQTIELVNAISELANSSNYFFRSIKQITIKPRGKVTILNTSGGNLSVSISITTATVSGVTFALNQTVTPGQKVSFPFNFSYVLPADEKLFFIITNTGAGHDFKVFVEDFSVSFQTINDTTIVYGKRPYDLFRDLVEKMTDNKYFFASGFLANNNDLCVVGGQSLRGLDNAVIVTSLEDAYASYNAVFCLGLMVINNTLYLERRKDMLPSTVDLFSGEVRDFSITLATNLLFGSISVGYKPQDYSERNGNYEFNTTTLFKAPIISVDKTLELISVYRGDCYGQEFIRGGLNNKDTTDAKSDTDVFFSKIIGNQPDNDGNYHLSRPKYSAIDGIPADMPLTGTGSVFNTEITPMRMLLNWGYWVRSVCFKLDNENLIFQTRDKNKDFATTLGNVIIKESANVSISNLEAAIFHPFYLSYKTLIPDTFQSIMGVTANRQVSGSVNQLAFYGYPLTMSVRPVFNEAQQWKVLSSSLNNIEDFQNLEPFLINTELLMKYNLSIPYLCPVPFVPIGNVILPQYNSVHMGAGFWCEQVKSYIQRSPYKLKVQQNDILSIQCYTNDLGPTRIDVIDRIGSVHDTISLNQVVTEAFKNPYILYQGDISMNLYPAGVYRLLLSSGTGSAIVRFISEEIDLRAVHPNTTLFKYKHRKNKLSTVFSNGYNPTFRIEAQLVNYLPKTNFTTYEDEPADIELIEAIPFDTYLLEVGKGTFGMPNYMIKKLNAIMSLSDVEADGMEITREDSAQFEAERIPGVAGAFYTLAVRKALNREAQTLGTDGNTESGVAVIYNIDTRLFGDLNSQVSANPVQVTKIENTD